MDLCTCVCVYVCVYYVYLYLLFPKHIYIYYICFSPCCFLIKKKTISEITLSPYTLEFQFFKNSYFILFF